jgi:hypothetical protein
MNRPFFVEHSKSFDACEWLAAMCSHIPNRGEQMVRYYGYYSNVCRGKRQQERTDTLIPCIISPDAASPARRRSWARLIQRIYAVDPPDLPPMMVPVFKLVPGSHLPHFNRRSLAFWLQMFSTPVLAYAPVLRKKVT